MIIFVVLHDDGLAGDGIGQVLLRLRAECLSTFGRVDARQPDLVLGVVGVEDHDRVAVRDPGDAAGESALRCGVIFWISQSGVCVLPS